MCAVEAGTTLNIQLFASPLRLLKRTYGFYLDQRFILFNAWFEWTVLGSKHRKYCVTDMAFECRSDLSAHVAQGRSCDVNSRVKHLKHIIVMISTSLMILFYENKPNSVHEWPWMASLSSASNGGRFYLFVTLHEDNRSMPLIKNFGIILEEVFPKNVWLTGKMLASVTPQWGAADAEIKVPSNENTELKRFPFKARRRYCQGFFPC